MYNVESKGKLFIEIAVILGLQFIMLIFRLVEPIHWPSIFPGKYTAFFNEFIYMGIELVLVIVIVAHFIFEIPFKELGFSKIKENIGSLILNLLFLAGSIGVAYFMSLFSKNIEIHWVQLGCQLLTNFVAIALIKELIFRGFLFRSLYYLTNGKGIVASLLTAVLFAMTYIPSVLISLNEVSWVALLQGLVLPFAIGLFLSLTYYYTSNLWIGVIFHGVIISLLGLEQDFAICAMEIIYGGILIGYLISKIVKSRSEFQEKNYQEINEEEEPFEEELCDEVIEEAIITETVVDETAISESIERELLESAAELKEEEPIKVTIPIFTTVEEPDSVTDTAIYETENIPKKMLNALDELHEELMLKAKAPVETVDLDQTLVMKAVSDELIQREEKIEEPIQESIDEQEEKTPDLFSVLSTDLEDEDMV